MRSAVSTAHGFRAFRSRNYRLLYGGALISYTGDWMDQVSLNWLVLSLTDSPVALGLVNFCRLAPILAFSLLGGLLADRGDRRELLIKTQGLTMLASCALVGLVFSPWLSLGPVLALTLLRGLLLSFDRPARQALIPGLVPREDLANALALHSALRNFTRILGPAVAGVLIATVGVHGGLVANALSFLRVLSALFLMRVPRRETQWVSRGVRQDLGEGLRYVVHEPAVAAIVTLTLVPMLFGLPYSTLVPVFARDVLEAGPVGYGLLAAATGLGALLGAVWLVRVDQPTGRHLLGGALAFGGALVGFGMSPYFGVSFALLVAAGFSQQVYLTTANALVQLLVPDELRGRVMSIYTLDRGLMPLGALGAGALAGIVGAPLTLVGMGLLCALLPLAATLRTPALRRLL